MIIKTVRSRRRRRLLALALCAAPLLALACGKKGPPLAPLRLVPAPVADVSAHRSGDDVRIAFTLPTANANGPGPIDLDRVEVYAVTIAPGTVTPPNRELLTKAHIVGTIAVKPPPAEGETPAEGAPADTRPAPGDHASFLEQLTPEKRQPLPTAPVKSAPAGAPAGPPASGEAKGTAPAVPAATSPGSAAAPAAGAVSPGEAAPPAGSVVPGQTTPPEETAAGRETTPASTGAGTAPQGAPAVPTAAQAAGAAAPGAAAEPATPPVKYPVRVYLLRGVARGGRPGQPTSRIVVPLVDPPPAPGALSGNFTERSIVLDWMPPVAEPGGAAIAFNVYHANASEPAINPAPVAEPKFEVSSADFGREQCFQVRSVQVLQNVGIEGAASPPVCVTPRDIFPPAAPQGLNLLVLEGAIELVWDANTEPDFAGYTVLRASAPGETLRPLTPVPIRETTFRDTSVASGTHYVYAVVAADRAGNVSPQSAQVEGTAR